MLLMWRRRRLWVVPHVRSSNRGIGMALSCKRGQTPGCVMISKTKGLFLLIIRLEPISGFSLVRLIWNVGLCKVRTTARIGSSWIGESTIQSSKATSSPRRLRFRWLVNAEWSASWTSARTGRTTSRSWFLLSRFSAPWSNDGALRRAGRYASESEDATSAQTIGTELMLAKTPTSVRRKFGVKCELFIGTSDCSRMSSFLVCLESLTSRRPRAAQPDSLRIEIEQLVGEPDREVSDDRDNSVEIIRRDVKRSASLTWKKLGAEALRWQFLPVKWSACPSIEGSRDPSRNGDIDRSRTRRNMRKLLYQVGSRLATRKVVGWTLCSAARSRPPGRTWKCAQRAETYRQAQERWGGSVKGLRTRWVSIQQRNGRITQDHSFLRRSETNCFVSGSEKKPNKPVLESCAIISIPPLRRAKHPDWWWQ